MIETRLGEFEEVLLLLVGILGEDDAYAFRIAEEFEAQTGRAVSIGAAHSTLDRLENKGFLKSEMGKATAERGGRRKRIFTITALGKRVLKDSRDFKVSLWQQYPAFAKLVTCLRVAASAKAGRLPVSGRQSPVTGNKY